MSLLLPFVVTAEDGGLAEHVEVERPYGRKKA